MAQQVAALPRAPPDEAAPLGKLHRSKAVAQHDAFLMRTVWASLLLLLTRSRHTWPLQDNQPLLPAAAGTHLLTHWMPSFSFTMLPSLASNTASVSVLASTFFFKNFFKPMNTVW